MHVDFLATCSVLHARSVAYDAKRWHELVTVSPAFDGLLIVQVWLTARLGVFSQAVATNPRLCARVVDDLVAQPAAFNEQMRRLTMLDRTLSEIMRSHPGVIPLLDFTLRFIAEWSNAGVSGCCFSLRSSRFFLTRPALGSAQFLGSPRIMSHGSYFFTLWEIIATAEAAATVARQRLPEQEQQLVPQHWYCPLLAVPLSMSDIECCAVSLNNCVVSHRAELVADAYQCLPATGLASHEFGKAVICKALWLLLQECKLPGIGVRGAHTFWHRLTTVDTA